MGAVAVVPSFNLDLFHFSGQSTLQAWTISELIERQGWRRYESWRAHEVGLCFQSMRAFADAFPTWQRTRATGRPAVSERTHLLAAMLRQFLGATFDQLEGYLRLFSEFFRIDYVPDSKTLSQKNRSRRFAKVLRRFHEWILAHTPRRDAVIATDSTGYGNTKHAWRTVDFGLRAHQDWIKSHAAIEVPQRIYVSTTQTTSRVHDSQQFANVWAKLPEHIRPIASLADAAYCGEECLATAESHGAVAIHGVRKDSKLTTQPRSRYQNLVNFARNEPAAYAAAYNRRSLAETTIYSTKEKFGHRLRCRHPVGRLNEIQAKETTHNVRTLTMRWFLSSG